MDIFDEICGMAILPAFALAVLGELHLQAGLELREAAEPQLLAETDHRGRRGVQRLRHLPHLHPGKLLVVPDTVR